MSPLKQSTNIAARMGRWSANTRKTAIFGWLAFVIASFAIGSAVGMETIDQNDANVGEARTADHIIRDAGFKLDEQMEYVLVQSTTKTAADPAFRAVVDQAIAKLESYPKVHEAPLAAREGQRRADLGGRPRGADPVQPQGLVRGGDDVHRHDRRRHGTGAEGQPRLHRRPGRLGIDGQGARQDVRLTARPRGPDLDPDHARDPAARVRLARRRIHPARSRADGRVRNDRPRRPAEPHRPDGRVGRRGHPPDRARSRRRLLAVLHPPRT